jgi:N-acetylmuramic acid 6-phosphate etherase
LSNHKLVGRAVGMIIDELGIPQAEAEALLEQHKNVRKAIEAYANK